MASAPPAPAVRNNTGRAGDQQHAHRGDNSFGHIAFRLLGLFSGQWDALNCKEEPDRERHRGPDAEVSERQERRRARGVGGAISVRFAVSKLPIAETAKISRPASAMARYMPAITTPAINRPPKPPSARPKFHPE